jgi:hypothetical protein
MELDSSEIANEDIYHYMRTLGLSVEKAVAVENPTKKRKTTSGTDHQPLYALQLLKKSLNIDEPRDDDLSTLEATFLYVWSKSVLETMLI